MLFPKFIVEDDNLILAKCTYHKHLAENTQNVVGGGWFRFEHKTKTFILGGESYDFGPAKIEDIKKCISLNQVYTNKRKTISIAKSFNFKYDIHTELINLKE